MASNPLSAAYLTNLLITNSYQLFLNGKSLIKSSGRFFSKAFAMSFSDIFSNLFLSICLVPSA